MPMRDILGDLNTEINSFTYDEKFLPDEIMWLLLALPMENHFGRVQRLKINIPRTIIFGVRKDGIQLYNDAKGNIVHKFVNVDQCMTAFRYSPSDVIAHEKEMSIRGLSGANTANIYKYQGMYNTNLTHKTYRRLIADTFKQVQSHITRNFSIREHITLRHGKYNKNPFNRAVYRLYGKPTILSITTNDTIMSDEAKSPNASPTRSKPKGGKDDKEKGGKVPKTLNWLQLIRAKNAKENIKAAKHHVQQDTKNSEKMPKDSRIPDVHTEVEVKPPGGVSNRRSSLKDVATLITYENMLAKQQIATKEQLDKIEKQSAIEKSKADLAIKAASEKKDQENAWYYDAEEEEQDGKFEREVQIRTLETFDSAKLNVTEMNELAAAELHGLLALIVAHINHLTNRQLSTLVVDFVKNSENQYVLNEIVAFQFVQSETAQQHNKFNVARRPALVKFQVESFFKCDLDVVSTDIEADLDTDMKDCSMVDEEHEGDGENMCAFISAALKARALSANDGEDLQTPNTVLCRMCNVRINSTSSRYHVTSTMIYSTVMHIRARIPSHDWPSFCGDNSFTLLSMHRNIKSLTGEGPTRGTTTETNLFLCASCYRLYQEETNLIQLEHQIGVLTKNQGLKPPSPEKSTSIAALSPPPTSKTHSMSLGPSQKHGNMTTGSNRKVVTTPPHSRNNSIAPSARLSTSSRPSSAPPMGKSRSPTKKKLSLFSSSSTSSRPSISSMPAATAAERFRSRQGSSLGVNTLSKEAVLEKKQKERARKNTLYQLAKPLQLAETYADSFLSKKKTPTELLSDSDIRDKFRDKNNPSNHSVPFFIGNDNKSKSINKPSSLTSAQLEGRTTYPKSTDPPMGNVVSRTDMPLHITVCRLAVNLHEVVDLPVAIFEAYENFSLCYVALGRRVDAPCTKTAGYKRHKESNFKEARPILNDINADSDSDSSSSGSSSSSSSSSSRSKSKTKSKTNNKKRSSKSENSKDSKKSKSASESDTDSDDENDGDTFGVSCASVEKEVVVGCLECKLFKVSYVMINGDAKSKEYHEPLTQFFQDFKCITVVLCANLKPNAVISENSWSIPNVEDLSNYKASRFRTKIRDIKKGKVDEAAEDASLKPLPRRRPSSSSVVYKVPTAKPELGKEYDPRAKVEHTTESGVILPSNALAYGHIPMTQFKGNTVQRLDVGIPLTYTLRHLPLARTVPMLKGMVGFDRPLYPIDIWALPYSMLQLNERNAYVPLVENQYSSTIPLPSEWVSVKMQNLDARRGKALFKQRSSVSGISGSLQGSMTDLNLAAGGSQKRLDIDTVKRNAPTIHNSQARSEITQMASERNTSTFISNRMRYEVDLEREPGSVWCVCIQVLSAHHIHSDSDYYSPKKHSFECVFTAFGDKTRLIGDVVEADGGEGGEVKFYSNETKYLLCSSIGALESMFDSMDPVALKFRPLKDNPNGDLPQFARTMSVSSSPQTRRKRFQRSERKMVGLGESCEDIRENRNSTGYIPFKNLHKDRFMEISVPVMQDFLTDELRHRNEMYPPYTHVILKLYRVGPPNISECGHWLPPRMMMGGDIDRGVQRVQYSHRS